MIIGYLGEIGRHPEIIEAAVRGSNEAKTKALRPLKSKFAELEKRKVGIYGKAWAIKVVRVCVCAGLEDVAKRQRADQLPEFP